jgi:flagellar protein FlgJ
MNVPPTTSPGPIAAEKTTDEDPKLRKVAQQFEALFTNQLLGAMRKTVIKQGYVPESPAERVYQGLLDAEYAQAIAESEQIGLSRLIYDHLLRTAQGR